MLISHTMSAGQSLYARLSRIMESDPSQAPGISESTASGDATTISLAAILAAKASADLHEQFMPTPQSLDGTPRAALSASDIDASGSARIADSTTRADPSTRVDDSTSVVGDPASAAGGWTPVVNDSASEFGDSMVGESTSMAGDPMVGNSASIIGDPMVGNSASIVGDPTSEVGDATSTVSDSTSMAGIEDAAMSTSIDAIGGTLSATDASPLVDATHGTTALAASAATPSVAGSTDADDERHSLSPSVFPAQSSGPHRRVGEGSDATRRDIANLERSTPSTAIDDIADAYWRALDNASRSGAAR